jgi:hypothetical protein
VHQSALRQRELVLGGRGDRAREDPRQECRERGAEDGQQRKDDPQPGEGAVDGRE